MPIKLTGLVFLAAYLSSHPLQFSLKWAFAYFGIAMLGVLTYVWSNKAIGKISSKPHFVKEEAEYMYQQVSTTKREDPFCFWLAPAESAFFYVPLLYFGLDPFSAAVAAILFGLMHYPQQMLRNCIFKAFTQYALIWIVLPHGILTMMAGHFFVDYLPLALLKWANSGSETDAARDTPNNGLKDDAQKQRAP